MVAAPEQRRILIVCAGNTCRSPMAAAILNGFLRASELAGEVRSAGLVVAPGRSVHANALAALSEAGLDVLNHESVKLNRTLVDWSTALIVVERALAPEILEDFPSSSARLLYLSRDVPDPYGGQLEAYRATRDQLRILLAELLAEGRL